MNLKEKFQYEYADFSVDGAYFLNSEFRKPITGPEYTSENIVIAGCSFTYGDYLNDDETFGAKLAELTRKYRVYNIGISGASPRETLYILRNYKKYAKVNLLPQEYLNTKYFIYTFINDQRQRLTKDIHRKSPEFKIRKDKDGNRRLEYINRNRNFIKRTFLYNTINNSRLINNEKLYNDLFLLYMKEVKREVDKVFPNAKFILFIYEREYLLNIEFENLEKENIHVIHINELSNNDFWQEKYLCWDKTHPNKEAWEEIVPLFVRKM